MAKMNKGEAVTAGPGPVKYKTEVLLNSRDFLNYQRDFAKALLTEPEYTLKEAKAILDKFFQKEEN